MEGSSVRWIGRLSPPFHLDSPPSFHPPPCFSTRPAASSAGRRLTRSATCEGGHGNYGRRRRAHTGGRELRADSEPSTRRRRMRRVSSPMWTATSSGKTPSPPQAPASSVHGDSFKRLLWPVDGAHAVGVGHRSPAPFPTPVDAPVTGVSCTGRRRSSGRRPWRAALEVEEDRSSVASTGWSCCNSYFMMLQ
ncbi:hypothetical protein PVAP13_4KG204000 [Panicum virgatum]|uniref:Uncharacterized protein n=1 Tax=Panicum virgatum TaxID=38727 RepID=A0A8T0TR05_PANVG|nr:hypothetical protein PVAP13_4KG204000 [Panicum virgatum]